MSRWVDGDLRYVDRAVGYRGQVRDLDVMLEGVRWPSLALESARLTARPPKGKGLSLSGSLAGKSGSLDLELTQLALPPLNAYSEPAGYRLSSGNVSLRTKAGLERVRASRRAIPSSSISSMWMRSTRTASAHSSGCHSTSCWPCCAIRPRRSRSQCRSRSRSRGGTTTIGLRSIVQSSLRQALVGAATSPLKMGGFALSTLGVGGGASEPLASVPGDAALAAREDDRIVATVALLASRPGLGLELRGQSGPEDVPHLAEEILIKRLAAGGDLPDVEDAGLLARRRVAGALGARWARRVRRARGTG